MKKNKIFYLCFSYIVLAIFTIACSDKFDEHYNPSRKIDKNIVQILSEDSQFSQFVEMIDKLNLRTTLGEGAIYTCLAPTNEQVKAFLETGGYATIDAVPANELRQYVNYHFVNGMYYKYDIEKRYSAATTGLNPTKATYYSTRSEQVLPGKYIRLFVSEFFNVRSDDYRALYGVDGKDFTAETVKISATKFDLNASNGVIHVLDSPLKVLPRTDNAIALDENTTIFNKWLESQVTYILGPKDEFGRADTTKIKTYSIGRNIADESVLSTVFVPTDDAIRTYFEPYMSDLYNTIDSIPKKMISEILKSCIVGDTWFKSDVVRNNPELRALSGYPQIVHNIPSFISGSILASNSVIYKLNHLIEPPKLNSVEGGVYIKYGVYGQWYWMFLNTDLETGLTEGLYYQHSPKTILLQPDQAWGSPLAQDMDAATLKIRQDMCRTGILNVDVRKDGGFRKRFYPSEFGYILFDNNKFVDYTGHSVSLLKDKPTWERNNGSIYEIDGFLTPLQKADTSKTVYALIQKNPVYSQFKKACIKSGIVTELNLTGFFTYTIFAPTNDAISGAGINIDAMAPADLLRFVNQYIIANRFIFSDGVYKGNVPDKNGDLVKVNGQWESFSVTGASGKTITPAGMNLQGSNGVVHQINQVF